MGIFEYKFDKDYTPLRLMFNYDTEQFAYYYAEVEIPYDKLTARTKKALKKENKKLIEDPSIIEEYRNKKRMRDYKDYLSSLGVSFNSFQALGATGGTMSQDMSDYLDKICNEPETLIGIHRAGNRSSQAAIEDVLTNGLILTGHRDGAQYGTNTLSNNISFYLDNNVIKDELMYAEVYKDSQGSYIIRIPLYDLEEGMVYRVDENGTLRVNPFYIIGYVPVKDKHIENIITRDDLEQNISNTL